MKPKLKQPGAKCLKLKYDILLSTSAFNFNLRRYTMVFVNSSDACEAVCSELQRQGLAAAAFHADVEPRDRAARLERLAAGEITVLVGPGRCCPPRHRHAF
jgi:superfamily II DNA/RNA helicase